MIRNTFLEDYSKDQRMKKSFYGWLGIFPIAFFCFTFWKYFQENHLFTILWVCNISNLTLGVGIMSRKSSLVWISTLWVLLGTPLWMAQDLILYSSMTLSGFFTHFGCSLIGLYAIRITPKNKRYWSYAIVYFIVLQFLTRLISPPNENINVAFFPYQFFFKDIFESYWVFWFVGLGVIGVVLNLLEKALVITFYSWTKS